MDGGAWWAAVHGVAKSWTWQSNFTFTFHFHALEKEMAIHSSVLAWRIPGMGEPGGLPSMGSHRVGRNWSDLVAAAALWEVNFCWWLANSLLLLRQFLYTVFLNLDPWASPIPSSVPGHACPGINTAQLSRCLRDSRPSEKDVSLNIKLFWNKHKYKFE